jgi:beta-glucanase (GH16 family)
MWDKASPSGVKWDGTFVGPNNGTVYISSRIKTDQVLGYSTWFAFWMFSETRAYANNPSQGTEIDVAEFPKGAPDYMKTAFNTAQHWNQSGGDEDHLFASWTDPPPTNFVNVSDSNFHIWGVEWAKDSVMCYVDGQLYYTFTDHIASDPVDMMMMLTFEFQPNIWNEKAGDGRSVGPFVSDNATTREMSRATVDYVRVYQRV